MTHSQGQKSCVPTWAALWDKSTWHLHGLGSGAWCRCTVCPITPNIRSQEWHCSGGRKTPHVLYPMSSKQDDASQCWDGSRWSWNCPLALTRLKLAESLKSAFQDVSPQSANPVSLTSSSAISAEAWTQGQLIGSSLWTSKALYSLPKITSPRPHPGYTSSQRTPTAPSPCPKVTSWHQGLHFASFCC